MANTVKLYLLKDLDGNKISPVSPENAIYDENGIRLGDKLKGLDLNKIKEALDEAIANINNLKVTPEMLFESTKQLIEASGGGTITNLPDDEDIQSVDDGTGSQVLKFNDRAYNPSAFSGKGYKILRKNIVDGKNVLTQEMINEPNTVYEIRYDFDLDGSTVNLPENCTLNFNGGTIYNGTLSGKTDNEYVRPEWFKNPNIEDWSDAIQTALNICTLVRLNQYQYEIYQPITLKMGNMLVGNGQAKTSIISKIDDGFCIFCNINNENIEINTWASYMIIKDLTIRYKFNSWQDDSALEFYPNAHCIKSSANLHIVNVSVDYFNKVAEFPNYADGVRLYYLTVDDRARLKKPDYDPSTDCNIIFDKGDCGELCFLYNCQIKFTNQPSVLVRNSIQCGFVINYSTVTLLNIHNENTIKYPIYIGSSILKCNSCYFHVPADSSKSIIYNIGFNNMTYLSLDNTIFCSNPGDKNKMYYNGNIINFNHESIHIHVNNTFRSISQGTKLNIKANIKENIITLPGENSCYKGGVLFVQKNIYKSTLYLYEGNFQSVDRKVEGADIESNLNIGKYTYKVTPILDKNRKIAYQTLTNDSYTYTRTEADIDKIFQIVVSANDNPNNYSAYIHRIFNDSEKKRCYINSMKESQIFLYDEGNTIVGNDEVWEDDLEEEFNFVSKPVNYNFNGKNVIVYMDSIPTLGEWVIGDKVIVNNIEYTYNGNKWLNEKGVPYGVLTQGTFVQKPASKGIEVGFSYFCTDKQTTEGATNGIMIYYKGEDVWVDALGRIVS